MKNPFFAITLCFLMFFIYQSMLFAQKMAKIDGDSLYIKAARESNKELYAEYIKQHPDQLMAALAACRFIQIEQREGSFLDYAARTITGYGIKTIADQTYSNAQTITFPEFGLRMILFDNPYVGQQRDPFVEFNIKNQGYIDFDFGALHVLGDKECYLVKFPNMIFVTVDSLEQEFIFKNKNALGGILNDFGRNLGFSEPSQAFRKLKTLEKETLTVFVYDIYDITRKYNLKGSGRSFATGSGFIHINSARLEQDDFYETFVHELSHVLLSRGRYNMLHKENRWFDEGFAMWAAECYLEINGLNPGDDQLLQEKLQTIMREARYRARGVFRAQNTDYTKFRSINEAWDGDKGLHGSSDSYALSLSIVAYIAERYGPDKLVKAAERVSLLGEKLTQKAVEDVLRTSYRELEQGWNVWVVQE